MGAIVSLTIPGGRQGKTLDDAVLSDAAAQLADAEPGAVYLPDNPVAPSGSKNHGKGVAGSTGYAYRTALRKRGIAVKSVVRTVDELRAAFAAAGSEVPDALKSAPGKSHAWMLVRAEQDAAEDAGDA